MMVPLQAHEPEPFTLQSVVVLRRPKNLLNLGVDVVVSADRRLHRLAQLVRVQAAPGVLEFVDSEHVDSHNLERATGAER